MKKLLTPAALALGIGIGIGATNYTLESHSEMIVRGITEEEYEFICVSQDGISLGSDLSDSTMGYIEGDTMNCYKKFLTKE